MKKKLFQKVFDKAGIQSGNSTKHGLSAHLERFFSDSLKFSTNRLTFVRYYEKYIEGKEISYNPKTDLLNRASEYIGYENYEDFVRKNTVEVIQKKKKDNVRHTWFYKNKIAILLSIVTLCIVAATYSTKDKRWMTWKKDHYVEVEFDLEKYNFDQLKIYKEEQIKHFKKVNSPNCSTQFFTERGKVKVWYWKKNDKKIELFTHFGLHPTTGKTLKPITKYMIQKYICSD